MVANTRRNAEANYGTYQSSRPLAVAVKEDGCVVGHVPRPVSRTVFFFLVKDRIVGDCEVTRAMVKSRRWIWPRISVLVYTGFMANRPT